MDEGKRGNHHPGDLTLREVVAEKLKCEDAIIAALNAFQARTSLRVHLSTREMDDGAYTVELWLSESTRTTGQPDES